MKRVLAACLMQTLRFEYKEELPREQALRLARAEVEAYKAGLARKGIKYRIDSEEEQTDGSIVVKVRKQNLTQSVGSYLD